MEAEVVHIIIKGRTAFVRSADLEEIDFPFKSKAGLNRLIGYIKSKHGEDIMITINYIDKGKCITINSNKLRTIIYPLFKQYKRIRYIPDRLVEVSVSNKDIKQDRLERLQRDMVRAKKRGDIGLMDRLFDQYLKLNK